MKKFKGMQGPWVASKTDRSIGPISRDDDQSYGMIIPVAWVEFDGNDEFQKANASLIASAPDILEALQAAMDYIDAIPKDVVLPAMPGFDRDWVDGVISKALGEE